MDLNGCVAVLTGSSSGIGAETAKLLAGKGCRVAINYETNASGAEETADACAKLGGEAIVVGGDVASDDACRGLARAAMDKWGRIDVLVNSAGVTKFAPADDLDAVSADDFMWMYAVNVVGPYQIIRACAPHMKAGGQGAVVNISSMGAVTGMASSVAYSASKGALNTMTLTLARALAPEIRVNCVCPALVDTRWNRQALGDERYEQVLANFEATTPLRHALEACDVAGTILWLIEGADRMTGEVLMLDSGLHLGFAPPAAR